jgi:hypothetical protein
MTKGVNWQKRKKKREAEVRSPAKRLLPPLA